MFPRHSDRLWLRSRSIPEDAVGNTPKVRRVSERRSAPSASRPPPPPPPAPAPQAPRGASPRRSEVIVSPYPGLDSPIVLSAWGRQLRLDAVDDTVIDQFYRAFRDRTAPEPGAPC